MLPPPIRGTSKVHVQTLLKSTAPDKFSGTDKHQDLEAWIIQVRRFHRLAALPDELLVDTAAAFLTDQALKVWNAAERYYQTPSLDDMFKVLRSTYGQAFPEHKIRRQLLELTQSTSVEQYARAFRQKVGQLVESRMSPADQIAVFMKDLKPDIRSACVWDPTTRKPFEDPEVLMGFAEAYDNALHHQQDQEPKASSKRTSLYQTSVSGQPNKRKRETDQSVRVQTRSGIWKPWYTPQYPRGSPEWLYITENGLCFHCLSDQHTTTLCPVKAKRIAATYCVVPPGWKPGMGKGTDRSQDKGKGKQKHQWVQHPPRANQ
jgi:hypothetical protein